MKQITIHLEKLQFFAYHGLYDAEKQKGGEFEVDVQLQVQLTDSGIMELNDTVDYSLLYQQISNRMQQSTELLETLCDDLSTLMLKCDDRILEVQVLIRKLNPPIEGMRGAVSVSCIKNR